nr:hypothetical protein [uncultured Schaedlerella sp.]
MVLGEQNLRFKASQFTVIPKNYPHTTNSDPGTFSQWEYLFVDVEGFLREHNGGGHPHENRTYDPEDQFPCLSCKRKRISRDCKADSAAPGDYAGDKGVLSGRGKRDLDCASDQHCPGKPYRRTGI